MKYSLNLKMNPEDRDEVVLAQRYDINASYKDLCAVCDSIRYRNAMDAMNILDRTANMSMPIEYRRHNKRMGSRHELGGRKGAFPQKAAKQVRITLVNALANATNKGKFIDNMVVVHATANKTRIERRYPSKGSLAWGRGMYGRSAMMHSDLEYAKVEIGLAYDDSKVLTGNMKYFINRYRRREKKAEGRKAAKPAAPKAEQKKPEAQKKEVQQKKAPVKKEAEHAEQKNNEAKGKAAEAKENKQKQDNV